MTEDRDCPKCGHSILVWHCGDPDPDSDAKIPPCCYAEGHEEYKEEIAPGRFVIRRERYGTCGCMGDFDEE